MSPLNPRHGVAAFDFDGTLTRRSQLERFVLEAGGYRRTLGAVLRSLPAVAQLPRSSAHRDTAKSAVLRRVFANMDGRKLDALGKQFALEVLRSRMRDDVLARLAWHQRQGHTTVIVSASLTDYLVPLGARLGVDSVLCTELDRRDGQLTGELRGNNVRGEEKVRRLEAWLKSKFDEEPIELWAYGDTSGDTAMLARADHATWITKAPITAIPN